MRPPVSGLPLVLILSFSASLGNPSHTLFVLLPAYFSFLAGMSCAGLSFVSKALEESAHAEHSAEAFNREEFRKAANSLPTVISSPRRLADEANEKKDEIIAKCNAAHDRAEQVWKSRTRWRRVTRLLLAMSAIAFVIGVSWPGFYIISGGDLVGLMLKP